MSFEDELVARIKDLEGRQLAQHWVLQALITTHPQPQELAELLLHASDQLVDLGHSDPEDRHWYKPLQQYANLAAETKAARDAGG